MQAVVAYPVKRWFPMSVSHWSRDTWTLADIYDRASILVFIFRGSRCLCQWVNHSVTIHGMESTRPAPQNPDSRRLNTFHYGLHANFPKPRAHQAA